MLVDDRLRQGLEANAASFVPRGEERLALVRSRRRRRRTGVVGLLVAAAVLVGAAVQLGPSWVPESTPDAADDCSSVTGSSAPEEDSMDKHTIAGLALLAALVAGCDRTGATADGPAGGGDDTPSTGSETPSPDAVPGIPEGGWLREVTRAQGRAMGVPGRTLDRLVGADGVLPLGFKLEQGTNFTIWVNDDEGGATAWDYGTYAFEPGRRLVLTTISDRCPSCTTTLSWQRKGADVVFEAVDRDRSAPVARWLWEGRWDSAS
jgi:hypothetical protein